MDYLCGLKYIFFGGGRSIYYDEILYPKLKIYDLIIFTKSIEKYYCDIKYTNKLNFLDYLFLITIYLVS